MKAKRITTPLKLEDVKNLKIGDNVLITGTMYTARDAAHKRLLEDLNNKKELPFNPEGAVIYYVGPCPPKEGQVIGSAGPTTSYRMDDYTPSLLDIGVRSMIGKGKRSEEVIESMKANTAIYFAAIGGAGALISDCIKEAKIIAYEELGTEAIRKIYVEDFPCVVAIDSSGNDLYKEAIKRYGK